MSQTEAASDRAAPPPGGRAPLLVRALRGERTERRPVWLMRQAGRYLPGYQAVRAKVSFLELCRRPDLSAEVSLEPVERFGVDGAIVFSDILVPLQAMGVDVHFDDGGPQIRTPVRSAADVARLELFDPHALTPWILETIATLRRTLPAETAVLGFCGAPWTLATYAVEGKMSKELVAVKSLMWREPDTMRALLAVLAESTVPYLVAQAKAGASALQVFDTWASALGEDEWRAFARPALRTVFDGVRAALGKECPPLVLYSQGTGSYAEALRETGADAFSVDWRMPLGRWRERIGAPVQGNMDPTALFGTESSVREAARRMLESARGLDGIAANLGHGVLVGTPPANVAAFVDEVKSFR